MLRALGLLLAMPAVVFAALGCSLLLAATLYLWLGAALISMALRAVVRGGRALLRAR